MAFMRRNRLFRANKGPFRMQFSGLCEQKSEERRTALAQKGRETAHAAREKIKKAQRACLHFLSAGGEARPRRSISHPEACRNFLEKQVHGPRPAVGKSRQETHRIPTFRHLCCAKIRCGSDKARKSELSLALPLAFRHLCCAKIGCGSGEARKSKLSLASPLAFRYLCTPIYI